MTEILTLEKDFLIVRKPAGVPTQSDPSGDPDLMTLTAMALKERRESDRLYLIHRLDRTVGGLVLFARTPKSAATLSALVQSREIEKDYLAVTDGIPGAAGEMTDYLYKDAAKGKSYAVSTARRGTKEAKLSYRTVAEKDGKALVAVHLLTGRYHQIRVQFSSRGLPLTGDKKYGSRENAGIALYAAHLAFCYNGRRVEITDLPGADAYPWNLFSDRLSGQIFDKTDADPRV